MPPRSFDIFANIPNFIIIPLLIIIAFLALAMFFKKAHEMLWDAFWNNLNKIFKWAKKVCHSITFIKNNKKSLDRYAIANETVNKLEEKSNLIDQTPKGLENNINIASTKLLLPSFKYIDGSGGKTPDRAEWTVDFINIGEYSEIIKSTTNNTFFVNFTPTRIYDKDTKGRMVIRFLNLKDWDKKEIEFNIQIKDSNDVTGDIKFVYYKDQHYIKMRQK